ncbi:MAG: ionic transporter y4hA [Pseudonocardia sp.]|nr:ionic transporter y4hA [Pseudonocardia sp.]
MTSTAWRVTITPAVALGLLATVWGHELPPVLVAVVALVLIAAVQVAVYHAEVVAHRVGEPFGSLVLAIAVTVIEVGLILSLMASGDPEAASLPRDTVFAAVMITCNGVIGLCLMVGALRHRVVAFNAEGSSGALATVAALATLCLVLPSVTTSSPGPTFSGAQLGFAAVMSLALYGVYVFVQTVRHRDYFLPVAPSSRDDTKSGEEHLAPPSNRTAVASLALLVISLVAVVGLAKTEAGAIKAGVRAVGAPLTAVGVAIALVVLLPETLAAVRAARRDRLQTSFNLALGSALASIGLTIPAIAVATIWLPMPLVLGLSATEMILLALSMLIGTLTVVAGRATVLQGAVHLLIFASFLFTAVAP